MNVDDQIDDGRIGSQLLSQLWNQVNVCPINQVFENIRDKISNPIRDKVWGQMAQNNEH